MHQLEDAVARFFPAGSGYDHNMAQRLIRWLDNCGFEIVAKDGAEQVRPSADK